MTDEAKTEWITERAGILQYDAGLSPSDALIGATLLWRDKLEREGKQ